jgi:hypothetical protein
MEYNSGQILKEIGNSNEFLVYLGQSNMNDCDDELATCLVVKPTGVDNQGSVRCIKTVPVSSLTVASADEWVGYINVSW